MHRALGGLALVLLAIGLWLALGVAPPDAVQGNVQRIMYVHVPAILTAYVAIGLVLVASVAYLWTRRAAWDRVAAASGELAVCFVGLTLATGSIWGKPTWGTWWTWDARLTSSAILFVIYLGYLLLRSVVDDPERGPPMRRSWASSAPSTSRSSTSRSSGGGRSISRRPC